MPLQITDLNTTTAETLAQTLVGRGIPISNVSFTGDTTAAGIFADNFDVTDPETIVIREVFTDINVITPDPGTVITDTSNNGNTTTVSTVNADGTTTINTTTTNPDGSTVFSTDTVTTVGTPVEVFGNLNDYIWDGVILSTGNVNNIIGQNVRDDRQEESTAFGLPGNAQLESLISQNATEDAFVLEFDFQPDLEEFVFRFVFASEEYSQFTNRQFNDAFAIFIDGPSQGGDGFNNENIALIPYGRGQGLPISVNSLDNSLDDKLIDVTFDEFLGDAFEGALEQGRIENPTDPIERATELFQQGAFNSLNDPIIANRDSQDFLLINPPPGDGDPYHDFEFNRLTTILEASTNTLLEEDGTPKRLIPNETYTLRLVIADTFDDLVDSAVFIEAQDDTRSLRDGTSGRTDILTNNPLVEPVINRDQVVAVRDLANTTSNEAVTIDVLANDIDPQREPVNINGIRSTRPGLFNFNNTSAQGGTIVRDDNGTEDIRDDQLIYTPPNNFIGVDTFEYSVTDDTSLSNGVVSTDAATVSINVFEETPITIGDDNNVLFLTQDPNIPVQGEFQVQFDITSRSASNVNEIGVVTVDNEDNTINGIAPGESGYIEEVINRSQVVFSSLTNRVQVNANSTRTLSYEPGDRLMIFLVQDDSIDGVQDKLNRGAVLPNIFFAVEEANADGFDHVQIDQNGNIFNLRWEDVFGGGDQDFNDFEMSVQITESQATPGTGLQGSTELIDLRDFNSLEAQFLVQSDAAFQNTVGFYQVDDESGTVSVLDSSGVANTFSPGDDGYARAAIQNAITTFDRNGTSNTQLSGLIAPFLISNADAQDFLDDNPRNLRGRLPLAYFPFIEANPDGEDHIRLLGDNTFGFEDVAGGGDSDFEDMVVEVDFI